jgi:hypothetical protein
MIKGATPVKRVSNLTGETVGNSLKTVMIKETEGYQPSQRA